VTSLVVAPLPLRHCITTLRVIEEGKKQSTLEWSSEFLPVGATKDENTKLLTLLYQVGLGHLQQLLTSK
jgi:hypothetical protein